MSRSLKLGKYRVIDLINPLKWWAVIDAWIAKRYVSLHWAEQVVYRKSLCPDCVAKGSCIGDCGCKMPDAMFAKDNSCSEGEWGPMYNEEAWETYKRIVDIQIGVIQKPIH